jgi:hypothetical protein
MGKQKQRKFARQIAREIIRELARRPAPVTPAPSATKKTLKQMTAEILDAAREYTRTSARLAGWDEESGDALMDAGYSPCAVDRAFAAALKREQ